MLDATLEVFTGPKANPLENLPKPDMYHLIFKKKKKEARSKRDLIQNAEKTNMQHDAPTINKHTMSSSKS